MGLESQLNDVSSESFPILLVVLIANCVCYLRSTLFTILRLLGLSHCDHNQESRQLISAVGSGLSGLIVLAEQLNLNRLFSYPYSTTDPCDGPSGRNCVVCLNRFSDGERVRKLACRHVFHKECFEGWLDHLNFNCPLCREPLVSNEHVTSSDRHVSDQLFAWFSLR